MKYTHKVHYYETDMMGVTHHSNYIRWMEEARIAFFDSIGHSYKSYEEKGIVSPVVSVECQYKTPTTYDDVVEIDVAIGAYKGARLIMNYTMKNVATEAVVLVGSTSHCFLDREGKLLIPKRALPELDEALKALVPE